MTAHQEYQSATNLKPRYEIKNDGDGDMLFLENWFTGEGLVLCGTPTEIYQTLEDAISHVPMGDKEPPMKPVQSLIQKAFDSGLFRYPQNRIDWSSNDHNFEIRRTFGSGVEFGYDLNEDVITFAWQSIDGMDIPPAEFLKELELAVADSDDETERFEETKRSAEEYRREQQPCQQYAQARSIVDEDPKVTEHSDRPKRWLVTQVTSVEALGDWEAVDRVNELHSSCELLAQEAEPVLERYRVGIEYFVEAEDEQHAIAQFHEIAQTNPDIHDVNVLHLET